MVDSSKGIVLFCGNRAHAVEPFVGERYSIVFFNLNGFDDAPQHAREFFDDLHIPFPDVDSVRYSPTSSRPHGATTGVDINHPSAERSSVSQNGRNIGSGQPSASRVSPSRT